MVRELLKLGADMSARAVGVFFQVLLCFFCITLGLEFGDTKVYEP